MDAIIADMERLKAWLTPPSPVQTCHCAIIKVENEYATLFGTLAIIFFCTTVALSLVSIPTQKYALRQILQDASDLLDNLSGAIVRFLAKERIFQSYNFISSQVTAKRDLISSYEVVSTWLGIARTRSNELTPATMQLKPPKAPSEEPSAEALEEPEYVPLDRPTVWGSQKDKLVAAVE